MIERSQLLHGSLLAALSIAIYLSVVVLTTPNLPAPQSMEIALRVNAPFIAALVSALWVQGFLRARLGRLRSCRVNKAAASGATSASSALSSFVSFLSLTHVGCCGFWIYFLSLIAGSSGAGVVFVGAVIGASDVFMWGGVGSVWALNLYLTLRMRGSMRQLGAQQLLQLDKTA